MKVFVGKVLGTKGPLGRITNRRQVLFTAGVVAVSAASFAGRRYLKQATDVTYLSAADDKKGNHYVVGLDQNVGLKFCISVPNRMHDSCFIEHKNLAIFPERRPGNLFHVVDTNRGLLVGSIAAPANHHFYGHATYLASTDCLYLTESEFKTGRGLVGVYQAEAPFKRLGQFASGGVGPHQIAHFHQSTMLVVANGGILTHPDSGRKKLNLPDMAPNLSYIDPLSGKVLDSMTPAHHHMSIRHIDISHSDSVAVGIQDQAEILSRPQPSSLVYTHTAGLGPKKFGSQAMVEASDAWLNMKQYIASVAYSADGQYILTTSPKGDLASLWNAKTQSTIQHFSIRDAGGAVWDQSRQAFIVSNGLGNLWTVDPHQPQPTQIASFQGLRWDNHLEIRS